VELEGSWNGARRWSRWAFAAAALLAVASCGDDDTGQHVEDTSILVPIDTLGPVDTQSGADTFHVGDALVPGDVDDGQFGAPCEGNEDCDSGFCVEGPDGSICTRECIVDCPAGFDCKGIAGQIDVVFICMPRVSRLCAPCFDDRQCQGGACLTLDGRRSCATPCAGAEDCPAGYSCDASVEAQGLWCQPETGSCTCNLEVDGGVRTCAADNQHGRCFGVEECDPLIGWRGCDARVPAPEVCDGVDNDCNGLVDDGLAGEGAACQVTVGGVGSCPGVQRCGGADGWVCQGQTPTQEVCDFQDNNCDGQTDEPFKVNGQYATFEHCGTCNRSCAEGFPGAQLTQCQVGGSLPQCVVVLCEPGFLKLNDFQCIPDVVNLCQACATDDNCIGQDSYCVTLSDGTFCGRGCNSQADCPGGFACQNVGKPKNQCVPTSGVCSCGPDTLGLSRTCTQTVSPPGQPSYTCAGTETCGAGGWGTCQMPPEVCDGVDNNCDGQIDETFKDAQGRYNRVEHCGACNVSCHALSFQNAVPICDTSGPGVPQCGYQCTGNWVDVDGLPGCECLPTSAVDFPDPDGIDANCDGIDGEVNNGVFVAKTGSDSASGMLDDPLRTIGAGITRAAALGRRDVYVATGVYVESISLTNGVSVYGGYSPSFRDRDVDMHETAIIGVDPTDLRPGTVNAISVGSSASQPIRFDGFTVFGKNNPNPGGNSYAIYARNAGQHLSITRNLVFAGDGGPGTRGSDGAAGASGTTGQPGLAAKSVGTGTCQASSHNAGGAGGNHTCGGVATRGGKGGNAVCPFVSSNDVQNQVQTPQAQEHGERGLNNGAVSDGDGGGAGWHQKVQTTNCNIVSSSNSHPSEGGPGRNGRVGNNGAAASGCGAGAGEVVAGHWRPLVSGSGGSGAAGGGGGGGGAAGGIDKRSECTNVVRVVAGSGGGGGSGGCGGTGASAGSGGGGSFGIFMSWSSSASVLPTVQGNVVYRGRGGAGGAGGNGGVGGPGGFGANGGPSTQAAPHLPLGCCSSPGGAGGNGGRGGHGAGGAGGCGGASYGTYLSYTGSPGLTPVQGNTYPASGGGGAGGAGGFSLGSPGPAGSNGTTAATRL